MVMRRVFQAFEDKNGASLKAKSYQLPAEPAARKSFFRYKLHCSDFLYENAEQKYQFQVTTEI